MIEAGRAAAGSRRRAPDDCSQHMGTKQAAEGAVGGLALSLKEARL